MIRAIRCLSVLTVLLSSLAQATVFEQVNTTSTQTLTNKTLTAPAISAPVLSGTSSGTYTIGGTVTITSPAISNPTVTGTVAGAATYTSPTLNSPVIAGGTNTSSTITTPTLSLQAYAEASLPSAGTAGRVVWLTDGPRGLIGDFGSKLAHLFGYNWIAETYSDCTAALSAISSTQATLAVEKTCVISSSGSIPSTLTVTFGGQGTLSVASGQTLTIAGQIQAPARNIFTGSGTVVFSTANTPSYPMEWFGTTTAQQQASVNGLASGQTLVANGTYTTTGLTLTNKSRVRITGKGSLTLSAAASGAMVFKLVGTLDDVEVDSLRLIGENNTGYTQSGIGNDSGQTISNVKFHDLSVSNINVGISLNADLSGSYTRAKVYRNYLDNIIGQSSGQGYGIHVANATNSEISVNHVNQSQRHGIYQAKGTNVNNRYYGNLITNHRASVTDGSLRAAFSISRSSGITVEANVIDNFYDSGMEISHVTSTSHNASDIDIKGNTFSNRHTAAQAIFIGEQQIPTTIMTSGVRITGNTFTAAHADVTSSPDIILFNGRNVSIKSNTFQRTGITSTAKFIGIGHTSYIAVDTDCDYSYVTDNDFIADGSVLTDVRAVEYHGPPVNTSHHWLTGNRFKNVNGPAYMTATRTNPNLIWEGEIGGREGIYTAADTTPSVKGIDFLSLTNAGAISITTLDDGEENQIVTLFFNDANTTIVDGATMQLAGSANFVGTGNDTLTLRKRSTVWYEVSRSVN